MKTSTKYLLWAALGLLGATLVRRRRQRRAAMKPGFRQQAIEAKAPLLQGLTPLEQFNLYLDGFHFENGQVAHQVRACHYCNMLNEDLTQCIIFDQTGPGARLLGVEYIISEKLFRALSEEEKPLWHSHVYEVKSGQTIAPGLPAPAEFESMKQLVGTYGKIWHTWDTAFEASLPLGIPKLMMAFTEDGQLEAKLLAERDRLLQISTTQRKKACAPLGQIPVADGADAWQMGEVVQLQLSQTGMSYKKND